MSDVLSSSLFDFAGGIPYAILDGASVPDLLDKLYEMEPEWVCLYRGELEPDLAEVAPYLVRLRHDDPFTMWVVNKGWGHHWGIFLRAPADIDSMRRHFRRFLIVHDPEGKPLYFRFYDPRVLRIYLPTCNSGELSEFFGPVSEYILEDESPGQALHFSLQAGTLRKENSPVMA